MPISADKSGDAALTVRIASASGDLSLDQTLSIPVRPAVFPVTTRQVVKLGPNGGSLKIDSQLLAASILDGAFVSVGVSPSSAFDIPSLLLTLDRYPYGCAEQTTSRALPLLYVAELAKNAGLPEDPDLRGRVQEAIYRVLNYQSTTGSFGLWSPGSGDMWLDSYVTDFLTRAREQGFDVPRESMLQALNNLQNSLAYDVDLQERSTEVAYALYVLSRNHKASIGDLRYYSDTQTRPVREPDGTRPTRREPGALRRHAARRDDLRVGAVARHGEHRGQLVPLRLRLAAPRRRRDAGARRRDQAGPVGRAGDDPLRRGRARQGGLSQHAGRSLDAARRPRHQAGQRGHQAHRQRHAA